MISLPVCNYLSGRPRIVKRLEHFFEAYWINNGEFSHVKPAEFLELNRGEVAEGLDDETLNNFEDLLSELNVILEEFDLTAWITCLSLGEEDGRSRRYLPQVLVVVRNKQGISP